MIVMPKPPVEVWYQNQKCHAVAYLDDMALVVKPDKSLCLFRADELDATCPTSQGTPEALRPSFAPDERPIRRGDLVYLRPYREGDEPMRVVDAEGEYVKLIAMRDGSGIGGVYRRSEVVTIPAQNRVKAEEEERARVVAQASGTGPVRKGHKCLYKGEEFVVLSMIGEYAAVAPPEKMWKSFNVKASELTPILADNAPPLVCPNHRLGADDRCKICGVSKMAIQKANESYLYDGDESSTSEDSTPLWKARVRHALEGVAGSFVRVVVFDETGVTVLTEPLPADVL